MTTIYEPPQRYFRDPVFHAAVRSLVELAFRQGYSEQDLLDLAHCAAGKVGQYRRDVSDSPLSTPEDFKAVGLGGMR